MIHIKNLSDSYKVRDLTENDLQIIYNLQVKNTLYYKYCPPKPSFDGIINDLKALPPGMEEKDKYYIGYFEGGKLIAIMDLIESYPKEYTVFIGFFMVAKEYQARGLGSLIIKEALQSLKDQGFAFVRLGYMKNNPRSKAFWEKCGFLETGIETNNGQGQVVVLEKEL